MRYPIANEPGDAKHAYGVVVPDLPGCFSAGDTLDQAITNVAEAIALWMEDLIENGETRSGFLARAALEALNRGA